MAEDFRIFLVDLLGRLNLTCSDKDIQTVMNIFDTYIKRYPTIYTFEDNDVVSLGFYYTLLRETGHQTEPTPFFTLLEIDFKIGWVNIEHLEKAIFDHKAIKIINDQKVT